MASNYDPNKWELYNPDLPPDQQPNSYITKRKLERMEQGIQNANIELKVGDVSIGTDENYGVSIVEDNVNKTKKLNVIFPPSGRGEPGKDGISAYQSWLNQGNTGTEQEFLDYLKGKDGKDGIDGKDGNDGEAGPPGESAYQSWLAMGNTGTEQDFFNSLKGETGNNGLSAYELWKLEPGNENKSVKEFYDSLKGEPGPEGPPGPSGETEFVDF